MCNKIAMAKRRVGIVGFGALGQHLARTIARDEAVASSFEVAFVWNRSFDAVAASDLVPAHCHCPDLTQFHVFKPDIICEVAHKSITQQMGPEFVRHCDYFAGQQTRPPHAAAPQTTRITQRSHTHRTTIPKDLAFSFSTSAHRH